MKMSPSHLAVIVETGKTYQSQFGGIRERNALNPRIQDQAKALRWALWDAVPRETQRVIYGGGCNDAQIDTALRAAMRELGEGV